MKRLILLASIAALSACSQAAEEDGPVVVAPEAPAEAEKPATAPVSHAHADFAGEWFGPEGLFAKVVPTTPGKYGLNIAGDLDAPAEGVAYQGRDAPGGIAFVRDGQTLLLKRATGEETGLTYLQGETDCLMVQDGEGFCRRGAGQ